MKNVVLAAGEPELFGDFREELERHRDVRVLFCAAAKEFFDLIKNKEVAVVAVAQQLGDTDGLSFVKSLVARYPQVACVMVSGYSAEKFHDQTEGLGVLMQLPLAPGAQDAAKLLELLESIEVLMTM
ncbi:response regulator [Desulforhopalus singaporensis]|uniref:Response regulator receiver domain-containing protein n=1 Tax=Desulforhopalus singaporensis TaxID=91360 RepID=A0A1H0M084_9BACT|nr:response regulator [Desulforhopalus singaporensis]SDO73868.1 Response regulator receiver domain-containing protein [Desulforhopalus singaporensis]